MNTDGNEKNKKSVIKIGVEVKIKSLPFDKINDIP